MEESEDPLLEEAISFVIMGRISSISAIQRHFRIGYNRATRIVEMLEFLEVISVQGVSGNREVLFPSPQSSSEIDFSVFNEKRRQRTEQQRSHLEKKMGEINSIEYQMRLEAITKKRIVIWLHQKTVGSEESPPVFIIKSYSPFKDLSEKQKIDKDIATEPLGEFITGYKFSATMQMRTPARILQQHGRIEKSASWKLPKLISETWQGIWSPITKSWREMDIDIDEMPMGTMASDIGQVPADGGDYMRFLLFIKHLNSLKISYAEKKEWINICYHMIGEDGEPFCKFMAAYGDDIEQMASRLLD
ncbi:hypothetical protein WM46_04740 [Citrobacter freundii complex sp. CFNIH2]|uniref:DNA translocase FtsK n=1 Tax=Citrobacter freundii complex sp. CFNIH2 TaxID=2066049 RepID=UPI000CA3B14A|nr:DNA translocase FtsK [Citrobacter freundii complex sp. CFNIH2]AUO64119.1 hypothetical protein WM46_04740 [Citrobacter freundii complex sp. CFNIH2]